MPKAFTLIELLVVITIIVVLLALLTPALDKAIYQAQLTVCGSHLHTIAIGAIQYAHSNKRRYPDRPARRSNGSNRPTDLYFGLNQLPELDDRKVLKGFIAINKTLNDPLLAEPIDIEGSSPSGFVASPYCLYFGWGFGPMKAGDKEMLKLGDRWTHTTTGSGGNSVTSFSVLCSDYDGTYLNDSSTRSSHPDREGVVVPYVSQDEGGAGYVGSATFSMWYGIRRPPVDDNFAFDDGSVQRIDQAAWDEGGSPFSGSDGRLKAVEEVDNAGNRSRFIRLPGTR